MLFHRFPRRSPSVDIDVATFADHESLTLPGSHHLKPSGFRPLAFDFEVSKFPDVMHLDVFLGAAEFARFGQESGDKLAPLEGRTVLVNRKVHDAQGRVCGESKSAEPCSQRSLAWPFAYHFDTRKRSPFIVCLGLVEPGHLSD